ncbi:thioredoxin family protein [Polaribacter litorisediminis]|uniref:thioredoxin family protein n=1 Tax=Polaribacter litorisediminis TaxID=1908341 RepID=UPI001CBF09C0|nr:thioredoxin family protein [Polaribacter litorisediminis]UAM99198.1 thioredoxin family protein [Polaribacter litorisediminis]
MKTIKRILLMAVVLIATAAFTTKSENGYAVGDTVEDFSLKNIDDRMVSLSDYKDAKGFIVVFTCNMCPYSVANEDRIIALDNKYKAKGYPVIAINPNDPAASKGDGFEDMKVRATEKGFTFPYLFDEGQNVYPKFGASKTPHVYIITKNDMKVQYIGAIDNSSRNPDAVTEKYVENAVDALLSGKKIQKTETRAIGCSIKVI